MHLCGFDLIQGDSHLSAGPVSFGFGSLESVWLGSCIHPVPVHILVYKQSRIQYKTVEVMKYLICYL